MKNRKIGILSGYLFILIALIACKEDNFITEIVLEENQTRVIEIEPQTFQYAKVISEFELPKKLLMKTEDDEIAGIISQKWNIAKNRMILTNESMQFNIANLEEVNLDYFCSLTSDIEWIPHNASPKNLNGFIWNTPGFKAKFYYHERNKDEIFSYTYFGVLGVDKDYQYFTTYSVRDMYGWQQSINGKSGRIFSGLQKYESENYEITDIETWCVTENTLFYKTNKWSWEISLTDGSGILFSPNKSDKYVWDKNGICINDKETEPKINIFEGEVAYLRSQNDVDEFSEFGYTSIKGRLVIGTQPYERYYFSNQSYDHNSITNIDGFNSITTAESITINQNYSLKNIDGLKNLKSVGSLSIINNSIENLNGLNKLDSVGNIFIHSNPELLNLDGLSNLRSVDGSLTIMHNNQLQEIEVLNKLNSVGGDLQIGGENIRNLKGLRNISSVGGDFLISGNKNLNNIQGIENITSINGKLIFSENDKITNIDALNDNISIGGGIKIEDNHALTNIDEFINFSNISVLTLKNNSALTNLKGLENLSGTIRLHIENNDALVSLAPLKNISQITHLQIIDNDGLKSLEGLENISSVSDDFFIRGNDLIVNLKGLEGIKRIGNLYIQTNKSLINLDGLTNISGIGQLRINNNDALTNLNGLLGISSLENGLLIQDNDALTNLDGLNNISSLGNYLNIVHNSILVDFCGIRNALNSKKARQMEITNNGFNISIKRIKDGYCKKELQ